MIYATKREFYFTRSLILQSTRIAWQKGRNSAGVNFCTRSDGDCLKTAAITWHLHAPVERYRYTRIRIDGDKL